MNEREVKIRSFRAAGAAICLILFSFLAGCNAAAEMWEAMGRAAPSPERMRQIQEEVDGKSRAAAEMARARLVGDEEAADAAAARMEQHEKNLTALRRAQEQ